MNPPLLGINRPNWVTFGPNIGSFCQCHADSKLPSYPPARGAIRGPNAFGFLGHPDGVRGVKGPPYRRRPRGGGRGPGPVCPGQSSAGPGGLCCTTVLGSGPDPCYGGSGLPVPHVLVRIGQPSRIIQSGSRRNSFPWRVWRRCSPRPAVKDGDAQSAVLWRRLASGYIQVHIVPSIFLLLVYRNAVRSILAPVGSRCPLVPRRGTRALRNAVGNSQLHRRSWSREGDQNTQHWKGSLHQAKAINKAIIKVEHRVI